MVVKSKEHDMVSLNIRPYLEQTPIYLVPLPLCFLVEVQWTGRHNICLHVVYMAHIINVLSFVSQKANRVQAI